MGKQRRRPAGRRHPHQPQHPRASLRRTQIHSQNPLNLPHTERRYETHQNLHRHPNHRINRPERGGATVTTWHTKTTIGEATITAGSWVKPFTIKTISTGYDYTVALDNKNQLWAWGSNQGPYSLNVEPEGDIYTPRRIPTPNIPTNTKLWQVSAGRGVTLLLDTKGHLYSWGDNFQRQNGLGHPATTAEPVNIKNSPGIYTYIYATKDIPRSYAIDIDGTTWIWGFLGGYFHNHCTGQCMSWGFEKVPLPNGVQLEQISDADNHGVAVDTKGNIWTWGSYYGGPLDGNLKRKPTKIGTPPDTKFEKVTALTDSCSIAIDTKKQTWKWGNCYRILPSKPGEDAVLTELTLTELPPEWKPYQHVETDINADYFFGVDTQNNLWVWNHKENYHANDRGQLGLGKNIQSQETPVLIPNPETP